MTKDPDVNLCMILRQKDILSKEELEEHIEKAKEERISLQRYIVKKGLVDEGELLSLISESEGIPVADLRGKEPSEKAVSAVPAKFAWHYNFVPVTLDDSGLTIAVNEPLSISSHDELRLILGHRVNTVLAKKKEINEFLKSLYGLGADTIEKMVEDKQKGDKAASAKPEKIQEIDNVEKLAGEASVINLVNQIIVEAFTKRATDIHIEPFRGKLRLRYRIDGVLQDQKVPEEFSGFLLAILSRIKIMSNLNIVERRVPQDGRAIVKTSEEVLDLRVSFIPTPHGESVVIRVLPSKRFFGLGRLGFSENDMSVLRKLMLKPNGIIFVTGPTGSGKSTSLYACLAEVDKIQKKVITIEDPIEYEMPDITQIQVNEGSGLTFAKGLRSMLRHDPDIMMVGEVRDRETAEIAIRVALTGHLILSTLHTNDAATGITRLIDIGIEPYLVASSVEAFVAQRLVRVICSNCKTRAEDVSPEIMSLVASGVGLSSAEDISIFKGKGCENCNYTGFYGRTAICEILLVDRDIKRMIIDKAASSEIKEKAVEKGMITLTRDGWRKVMKGVTTPEEVIKVCQDLVAHSDDIKEDKTETIFEGNVTESIQDAPGSFRERRIYKRMPLKVDMSYRLVDKAEGDIFFVENDPSDSEAIPGNIFTRDIFTKKISSEDFSKELYHKVSTTTCNLSAGGAFFQSRYSLPVGSVIEINMGLTGMNRDIKCLAKVVRVEKDFPRSFYLAVCFLDMSGEDRKALNDLIDRENDVIKIRELRNY